MSRNRTDKLLAESNYLALELDRAQSKRILTFFWGVTTGMVAFAALEWLGVLG